jgi:hypothetical protein
MRAITKKIIALTLVIIMAFSMANVGLASTSGGRNDVVFGWGQPLTVYLSHSNTLRLLERATPTGISFSTLMDILNPTSGTAMLSAVGFFARHINSATIEEIRVASRSGNGVRISFPWHTGLPTVRAQAGAATPAAERVQISISASPSQGGRLSGGGSLIKGTSTQVNATPNSGWQFDGWYEGNTRVSQNTSWRFTADRNRTLEARFRQGASGGTTTPTQSQLTVTNTVNGTFIVTIPANTTVYGFSSPTATTRQTLYTPRPSFQLHCTQRLTMSDGTTRYLFRSGGATARDWYLQFTSAMSVVERTPAAPTPIPSPPPATNELPDNVGNTTGNISNGGLAAMRDGWIYYRNTSDGGRIYAMRADGSDRRRVSEDGVGGNTNVVGDTIYYTSWQRIYSIRTDGSNMQRIGSDEWVTHISVIGDWIYYVSQTERGVIRIRTDGSGRQQLNDDLSSLLAVYGDVIYYSNRDDNNKLYTMRVDGSDRRKLSDDQAFCINVVGNVIYYLASPSFYIGHNLYSMRTDGTERTNLSDRFANSFLSGGTYFAGINVVDNIIYCFNRSSSYWGVLFKMNTDGSNGQTIYNAGGSSVNVVGDWIFYYNSDQNVRMVRTDGSEWQHVS